MDLESQIIEIQNNKNELKRNTIIDKYTPFIIKTTSNVLGRYIEIENDEEFMIALEGFNEAINRFKPDKGRFISFAQMVIRSRILDHLSKAKLPIDEEVEVKEHESSTSIEKEVSLQDEIKRYQIKIKEFGLSFEDLIEESPTHKETRCRCLKLARLVSKDSDYRNWIMKKKRLPITKMALEYSATKRMIKYSKKYILSLAIVYIYKFDELEEYINYIGGDCDE